MRNFLISIFIVFAFGVPAVHAASAIPLYKNPNCGCCDAYARYLESYGLEIDVRPVDDLPVIKQELGVPDAVAGCHTIRLGRYVVEGHVPIEAIARLVKERPAVRGIAVPGMPSGSPGMSGVRNGPLVVKSFGGTQGVQVFGNF